MCGGQYVIARAEAKCPGQGPSADQLCARCGCLPSRVMRIPQRPTPHVAPWRPYAMGNDNSACSAVQVLAVVQRVSPRVPISVLRAWQHLRYFSAPPCCSTLACFEVWRQGRVFSCVCDVYTQACVRTGVRTGVLARTKKSPFDCCDCWRCREESVQRTLQP